MDWGDNGPLLLLLHGDMRTSRSWDAVARELASWFHVIALDARGHGDSDWTRRGYSMSDRVEDLAAFCEYVGLRGALAAGHSTGGVVVALCAERLPAAFSRLVLMEPLLVLDDGFQTVQVDLPAVVSVSNEFGEPRYPQLRQIMLAAKKTVQVWSAVDLGLGDTDVGEANRWLPLEALYVPRVESNVEVIEGDSPEEKARNLALKLREAKLI